MDPRNRPMRGRPLTVRIPEPREKEIPVDMIRKHVQDTIEKKKLPIEK